MQMLRPEWQAYRRKAALVGMAIAWPIMTGDAVKCRQRRNLIMPTAAVSQHHASRRLRETIEASSRMSLASISPVAASRTSIAKYR